MDKYDHIQKKLVRSVGVLYEGRISSKSQYNRKRSCEIFEVDENGKKHRITYMARCKFPKLVDYKHVMQFVDNVDTGELKDIPRVKKSQITREEEEPQTDGSSIGVSGCYRELEPFLVKIAGLYLEINKLRPVF